jgi:hypothetical protein
LVAGISWSRSSRMQAAVSSTDQLSPSLKWNA